MRPVKIRPAVGFVAMALPLMLGGCSWLNSSQHPTMAPSSLAPTVCTPGTCTVTVKVTGTCASPGDITVDQPLVTTKNAVNMRWVITPSSFSFAPNGIQIDPADAQFEPKPSPQPNEFRLFNHHRSNGDFYYYINIQGCARADPFIRND